MQTGSQFPIGKGMAFLPPALCPAVCIAGEWGALGLGERLAPGKEEKTLVTQGRRWVTMGRTDSSTSLSRSRDSARQRTCVSKLMGFSSPSSQHCELELLRNTSKKLLPEAHVGLSKSRVWVCVTARFHCSLSRLRLSFRNRILCQ